MEHETTPPIVRLPGIGTRIDVTDALGRPVQVVRRKSGEVEIHAEPGHAVELDAATAETVGAFLAGHDLVDVGAAQRLADAVGGLRFDWVRLEAGDHAVGASIAALGIRRRTGVSIAAILRRPAPLVDPDPTVVLQPGDELVILCRPDDREPFVRFVKDGR